MDFRLQSPYCSNYKIPTQHKGLIMQHLIVRKLTRRELEDKYLRLIDENYDLKRENNMQKEKIKVLTTKLLRLTKENSRYKSRDFLFMDEANELNDLDEYFRNTHRPVSSSALPRKPNEETRNSTPNLSRLKSDLSLLENAKGGGNHSNTLKNTESENSNALKNMEDTNNKLKEKQEEIENLQNELKRLHEIEELERQTNAQLEFQVNELRQKLATSDVQKNLEANVEIAELNKRIKQLQARIDEMEAEYKKKMENSKTEHNKMTELLEIEKNKIRRFEAQSHDMESTQKMIDDLMQQVSLLEKEKMEMASQYEKYASYSDEIANYKMQVQEMKKVVETKEKELEEEKADKESVQHSQDELLRKMKQLQQDNDELVVKLEGLKSENETLLTKNKKLEDRVKSLEDENKKHLRQVNETLKMPTPITKDRETLIANSAKDVQLLQEIHERHQQSQFSSPEKSIHSYGSSPPNLSVPSVLLNDERRPSTSDKDLKVIPTIVEPHSSHALHSHDEVSTLPRDSSGGASSKNFAEMFSQSVSKETPNESVDDDFDPKTFSIDQIPKSQPDDQFKSLENVSHSTYAHAQELLKDEMSKDKQNSHAALKKVRLSMDLKLISAPQEEEIKRVSSISTRLQHKGGDSGNLDSLTIGELLKRRTSSGASSSTTNSFNSIPKFILENLNDERLILKHSAHKIGIEIINLVMSDDSALLLNENANFLYIEYTFLNYKGHLLETQSLPKPKKSGDCTFYHFKRTFEIKPSEDRRQFKMLKIMLEKKSKHHLKFLIVSEPISLEENEVGECEEVGFAVVKLCELVEASIDDVITSRVECFSTEFPHELIAYLNIKITGAETLKKLRNLK